MNRQLANRVFTRFTLVIALVGIIISSNAQSVSGDLGSETFQTPSNAPTLEPMFPQEQALQYIAQRENVPVNQLQITNVERVSFELLGREFWHVKALSPISGQSFGVAVDLIDGSFTDDLEEIQAAERALRWAQYGKFEAALYEQLQAMGPEEHVTVIIRVNAQHRSVEELYGELAARYPEAQAALESTGNPFEVSDYKLNMMIENEYVHLIDNDLRGAVQSLADDLQTQGYIVTTYAGLPAVAATLPKNTILDLAQRDDVSSLFLAGYQGIPALDVAVPTNRAPAVWKRGLEGSGISIGILEPGKVDFTGPVGHNWLHQGLVRACTQAESVHKTLVSSAAASYHDILRGMAPQATINDACAANSDTDVVSALAWATNNSDPINISWVFGYSDLMTVVDWAFDYWAREGNDTVTAGAGNSGGSLGSPAKAYNVITVGCSDDSQTTAWGDDVWCSNSSYINPINPSREKPEVMAPGAAIEAICLDNGSCTGAMGTSSASPQVAGLAALLMNRHTGLAGTPNAVKAIIMASAAHNIEGNSRLSDKDGAGAIDAALADIMASTRGIEGSTPCNAPCWWNNSLHQVTFQWTHLSTVTFGQ